LEEGGGGGACLEKMAGLNIGARFFLRVRYNGKNDKK